VNFNVPGWLSVAVVHFGSHLLDEHSNAWRRHRPVENTRLESNKSGAEFTSLSFSPCLRDVLSPSHSN